MITPECNVYLNQEVAPLISRYENLERRDTNSTVVK